MDSCVFCKIANHTAPSDMVYEDDELMVFTSLYPKAPIHLLVCPKVHIASLTEVTHDHIDLLGRLVVKATDIARTVGIADAGYKLSVNVGDDGGQVIPHLHVHLLGGDRKSVV